MRIRYVAASIILSAITSILLAESVGAWHFDAVEDGCKCRPTLNIWRDNNGNLRGTLAFPGAKVPLQNIVTADKGQEKIQFIVEQPENDQSIIYSYQATIEGDSMTGEYRQKGSNDGVAFHAMRQ